VASTGQGCPFDCGLCEAHGQRTCTVLVEVTSRCDLGCPVCFADAGSGKDMESDPGLDDIGRMLARARELAGPCTLQLSGGEPCVRDDLPDVVARAAGLGFGLVQLNTNGLRIARDGRFAADLAGAGLGSAFLQFDGVDDGPYLALRGRSLVRDKLAAVERLAGLGIGVVLVATLKPGVNDQALGDLLRFAVAAGPGVRGLHFQPVSYFGRYPAPPRDRDRLTLPEVMRLLDDQARGLVRLAEFAPPACEHALCSFHATYLREGAALRPLTDRARCCAGRGGAGPLTAEQGAAMATAFTARQWAAPAPAPPPAAGPAEPGGFDAFLARAARDTFTLSAMAFQDCWTLDLERLRGCCIHCLSPDGRLVPFCAWNLTAVDGRPLHRRRRSA
jgi:uncharacterized radical SAM superfamily Fe-S cluster-containing enzyme